MGGYNALIQYRTFPKGVHLKVEELELVGLA